MDDSGPERREPSFLISVQPPAIGQGISCEFSKNKTEINDPELGKYET